MVARTDGFPLLHHSVFFSGNYQAEFDDIFRRRRLPVEPTVYICAQDRTDHEESAPLGDERLLCLVNAPATGDTHPLAQSEIDACEERTFHLLRRAGLDVQRRPDATVRTTPADFNRLFPATGGALYGQAQHGWMASFRRPGARTRMPGLYLAGGSTHPGPGPAHGGTVGPAGSGFAAFGPRFDRVVEPGGYAWWYVDALSDDGQSGLAVIAFIGSVFSPYYASARRRQAGDPLDHCALNVALYRPSGSRWAMTERRRSALHRTADALAIGPSSVSWDGQALSISIAEVTVPFPSALRGRIRVFPTALADRTFSLDLVRPSSLAAHRAVRASRGRAGEPGAALVRYGLRRQQRRRPAARSGLLRLDLVARIPGRRDGGAVRRGSARRRSALPGLAFRSPGPGA